MVWSAKSAARRGNVAAGSRVLCLFCRCVPAKTALFWAGAGCHGRFECVGVALGCWADQGNEIASHDATPAPANCTTTPATRPVGPTRPPKCPTGRVRVPTKPPCTPTPAPQQPGAATVAPAVARGAVLGTRTRPVGPPQPRTGRVARYTGAAGSMGHRLMRHSTTLICPTHRPAPHRTPKTSTAPSASPKQGSFCRHAPTKQAQNAGTGGNTATAGGTFCTPHHDLHSNGGTNLA